MTARDHTSPRLRTWRAGRGELKVHALSIFSLAVAFVCLASALLVVTNIAAIRERWSHAGRATVYLRLGAAEKDVTDLMQALEKTPGVQETHLLTSQQARAKLLATSKDEVLQNLPDEAFPASVELSFVASISDQDLQTIANKLRAIPTVESVETYAQWTDRLSSVLHGGVTASLCLAAIVLCAVASVIGSTMRLLLHRRKSEVEVLKLVGATDGFVRRPFVIEAAAQGAFGALAAVLLLFGLYLIALGRFDAQLANLMGVAPSFLSWQAAAGMVLLGGFLGASTAFLTLRKMARI